MRLYDVVLGADVAEKLGYKLGSKVVVAHGIGNASFSKHEDKPFTCCGHSGAHRYAGGSARFT